MPVTKEKEWQFAPELSSSLHSVLKDRQQDILWLWKELMTTGSFTSPWTVVGSSDAVSSNMTGTDLWDDYTKPVFSTGNHGWIVLSQSALPGNFSILFDCDDASGDEPVIAVSPLNGFGSANGGTDGSISARPTATDEIILVGVGDGWIDNSSAYQHYYPKVIISKDGQNTRFCIWASGSMCSLGFFEIPKNPIPEWQDPVIFGFQRANAAGVHVGGFDDWNDLPKMTSRLISGSQPAALYLGTLMYGSAMFAQNVAGGVAHAITGEWPLTKIDLISYDDYTSALADVQESWGLEGIWGEMYDIYWSSDDTSQTDTYDSFTWANWDRLAMPWTSSGSMITG